jgi:hypothetical protein
MKARAAILFASVFLGGPAFACSCMAGVTVAQHYDSATHVFSAVVTRVSYVRVPTPLQGDPWLDAPRQNSIARIIEGQFRVTSTFKGEGEFLPAVYTHIQSQTCGVSLTRGQEFLFFADERGVIGLCGGNVARSNPAWHSVIGDIRRHQAQSILNRPPPVLLPLPDD